MDSFNFPSFPTLDAVGVKASLTHRHLTCAMATLIVELINRKLGLALATAFAIHGSG
jgi:hypothetical protein